MAKRFLSAPDAGSRLASARAWLAGYRSDAELLVVAANADAANELLRSAVCDSNLGAVFGWQRATLGRLGAQFAAPALAEKELVPVSGLGAHAVVARAVHALRQRGALGRFRAVAAMPGFVRAAARTFEELRMARAIPEALSDVAPELGELVAEILAELARRRLVDRAQVFELAARAARGGDAAAHPQLGLPILLLDIPLWSAAEAALTEALVAAAPEALATFPAGDERTERRLAALGFSIEFPSQSSKSSQHANASSLQRMQSHLFEDTAPGERALDRGVVVLSAPGESRECVEVARRLLAAARRGVAFDRMAVLLRSPDEYRSHLEEALRRAGIPAHFARGAVQPDPAGRAFAALLACAAEGLSARRFAEYLSFGELPDATGDGTPPEAALRAERWVVPDVELVPRAVSEALGANETGHQGREDEIWRAEAEFDAVQVEDPDSVAVTGGTLRAPRRWEKLLVDAAVIGGRERWERRLEGLERELTLQLEEREDSDVPATERVQRQLADLAALRAYALPLIGALAALPERATWGQWSDALSALASRALRNPARVLSALAELAPMAEVGPVDLEEVRLVLSRRLLEVAVLPSTSRHGKVFIAPTEAARGLAFDVVCVPGLAEKLFPREIREEPLLLDRARRELAAVQGVELATNEDRVRNERLALRLAIGAAQNELVLSYPRLDLEKSRPRVPSFYALEALRAGEGVLPGFAELAARAETVSDTRVGWPAPRLPEDAIDDAEHDLALLDSILRLDEQQRVGTARYLLGANPHLGRALRFRARRWIRRWTPADGLVEPDGPAALALAPHRLAARSYSATALENFAKCPYRFFLQAILRLAPREMPEGVDEMNPLQRGSLVHEVQFELYCQLRDDGLLPVKRENLVAARATLDTVLDAVAAQYREELAPAIDRVWDDGVATVRTDLREWLRLASEDTSGFVPVRFELAFGLPKGRDRDIHSRAEPVPLDAGLTLRGSIDLVERDAAGRLRVTDHKTGKVRMDKGSVSNGGTALQPVLYALAAEKLFPDDEVLEGRLYYCTTTGGFEERSVPLDAHARRSAEVLAGAIDGALDAGFLPAYPAPGACRFCDYRVVCGPYEELRTAQKPAGPDVLRALAELRDLP